MTSLQRRFNRLTPAQRHIFALMLCGDTAEEMARRSRRSVHTVINHQRKIYEAFGVNSHPKLLALFVDRNHVWVRVGVIPKSPKTTRSGKAGESGDT